jgi:hypothetical protein
VDDDEAERQSLQPLLKLDVAIHRDERVDVPGGATEKLTVLLLLTC